MRCCWLVLWDRMAYQVLRHCSILILSAVQTNSSLPVSPFIWSFTSPHCSFRLSSPARNPKWSDKSHQTVLCRTSGSWSPNSPRSNIKSSSVSVKGRAACGRFPLPKSRTNCLFLEERVSRDKQNSWSFRILRFEPWSFIYRCRLRWNEVSDVCSYWPPFFFFISMKKREIWRLSSLAGMSSMFRSSPADARYRFQIVRREFADISSIIWKCRKANS